MNDATTNQIAGSVHSLVHGGSKETRLEAGERSSGNVSEPTSRTSEAADRSNEIREIATNLERLCIEYACHSRVNGVGNETRAVWSEFKAEIERLKAIA